MFRKKITDEGETEEILIMCLYDAGREKKRGGEGKMCGGDSHKTRMSES